MMNRIEAIHMLSHLREDLIDGVAISSEHYTPEAISEIINYIETQDDWLIDLKNHKGSLLTFGTCPVGTKKRIVGNGITEPPYCR